MFRRLFLFASLVPLIDIVLLAWIATKTSWLFVLALVIGTGILGAWLARHQGLRTLRRIASEMEAGRMPTESLLDGLLVLIAAVLLIIPGVLTDVVAIALLFPPSRRFLKEWTRRRLQASVIMKRYTHFDADHDQIIDVRVIENPPRQLPH